MLHQPGQIRLGLCVGLLRSLHSLDVSMDFDVGQVGLAAGELGLAGCDVGFDVFNFAVGELPPALAVGRLVPFGGGPLGGLLAILAGLLGRLLVFAE